MGTSFVRVIFAAVCFALVSSQGFENEDGIYFLTLEDVLEDGLVSSNPYPIMLEVIHNASYRSDVDEQYMFRKFDPTPDEDETSANAYLIELDKVSNSIDGIEDDEVSSQPDILEMEEVSSVFDDIDEDDQVSSESITENPIVTYMVRFEAKAKAAIAKLQPIENEGRSGKAA